MILSEVTGMRVHTRRAVLVCLVPLSVTLGCSTPRQTRAVVEKPVLAQPVEPLLSAQYETLPEMIHYEPPTYPRLAERARLEGTAWIKVRVETDGSIAEAQIHRSSGHDILDRAALDACPRCRFIPAMIGGKPVAVWAVYKVKFALVGR